MEEKLKSVKALLAAVLSAMGAFLGWRGILLVSWVFVMLLDYLSGTMAACKAGSWSSATARAGLWHKGGMILVVTVGAMGDLVMAVMGEYLPLGLEWPGILLPLVLGWYIVTELGSVLENAVKMGAKVPRWLIRLLQAGVKLVESAGETMLETKEED